jgi:hypothetical protein
VWRRCTCLKNRTCEPRLGDTGDPGTTLPVVHRR